MIWLEWKPANLSLSLRYFSSRWRKLHHTSFHSLQNLTLGWNYPAQRNWNFHSSKCLSYFDFLFLIFIIWQMQCDGMLNLSVPFLPSVIVFSDISANFCLQTVTKLLGNSSPHWKLFILRGWFGKKNRRINLEGIFTCILQPRSWTGDRR